MNNKNENYEKILDEQGNVIAERAGGGHLKKLNVNAIRSLVRGQQVPITVKNELANTTSSNAQPSKILVIRDMGLGDVLMTLPVLLKLKQKYPQAEIHFATKPEYMELARPYCDQVFSYRDVSPNAYDRIINLVMFCELHKDAASKPRQDILLEGGETEGLNFSVEELSFAEKYLENKDKEHIKNKLTNFGVNLNNPKIAFCTDSNRTSKNWAPQKFDKLAVDLAIQHPNYEFIFFGAASKNFTEDKNIFDLTNKLSLKEFIAALNECDLIVTLETGAMHVAGMLKKPFIVICGPSDYRLFTKYYNNYSIIHPDIACYPCNGECETNRCIRIISTQFVEKVIEERLNRPNDNFTAIYPTSRDVVDVQLKRSANIQKIGILSVWAEQGLGYLTQNFRRALEDDFEVFIFGTFPLYAPGHAVLEGEWDVPNLHLSAKTRDAMDIGEVLNWVESNHIEAVILMEPVGDKIWQLALELKGSGIYTVGVPMIEITKADEILNHTFLNKNISLTQQCHQVLIRNNVLDVINIPYGIPEPQHVGKSSYITNRQEIVFYFNAGWADERKNAEVLLSAFTKAAEVNKNILLFFHSQAGLESFPPSQREIMMNNPQIVFSSGSLSYEEIMQITNSADVMLIPTKREGLGILFLEALAFGKPIIAADYSPMNEYVRNNINGFVCSGKVEPITHNDRPLVDQININENDLCEKILKIADPVIIENFSKNSRQIYEREYSFEGFAHKLKTIFSEESTNRKIFFIGNYLYPKIGGAEQTALLYLAYLANNGYDVYALCDKGGVNAAVHRVGDFFTITKAVQYNGIKIIQSAENVEKCAEYYIDKIKPDLVLTQLSMAGEIMKVAQAKGIPTAMYLHSVAEHFCSYHTWDCNGGKQNLLECSYGADFCMKEYQHYKIHQFDYADYIFANSNFTRKITKRFYDRDAYVLYPPIHNIERVEDPYNKRYILLVNPVIDKGLDIFCAVAEMLPQYIFLIVGVNDDGIRAQIINEKAPTATLATMGYAEDINEVYEQCRLVLMPSTVQEGFGMIAAEAMYAGLPVITSGRGGLRDVSGDAAIIIDDYTSVEKWAEAIKTILEDKEYYEQVRAACMEHAEKFILENQGKILLNIMQDIFGGRN